MEKENKIEMDTFIRKQIEKKYSKQEIEDVLIEHGFNESYVHHVFSKSLSSYLLEYFSDGHSVEEVSKRCISIVQQENEANIIMRFILINYTLELLHEGNSYQDIKTLLLKKGVTLQKTDSQQYTFEDIIYGFVSQYTTAQLERGRNTKAIYQDFLDKGFEEDMIKKSFHVASTAYNEAIDSRNWMHFFFGFLILMVGLGVTFYTYENAGQEGGRYYILYGAILYGTYKVLTSLFKK